MELPGLANPKRNVLRGIASLAERPSKNKAERSEAKTPGAPRWIPPPDGSDRRRWPGGEHAIGDRRSRERPITRYVSRWHPVPDRAGTAAAIGCCYRRRTPQSNTGGYRSPIASAFGGDGMTPL